LFASFFYNLVVGVNDESYVFLHGLAVNEDVYKIVACRAI